MYEDEQVQHLKITPLIFGLDDAHPKEVRFRSLSPVDISSDTSYYRSKDTPSLQAFVWTSRM